MLTMVLGGLWHGAGWTFIFWGFLHGGAMIVEHARVDKRKRRARVIQRQRLELAAAFDGIAEAAPLPEGPGAAPATAAPPLEYDRRPWHGAVWPRLSVFAFVTFRLDLLSLGLLRRGGERHRAAVPELGEDRRGL